MTKVLATLLILISLAACGKTGEAEAPVPSRAAEAGTPKYTAKPSPVEERAVKIIFSEPPASFSLHQENTTTSRWSEGKVRIRKILIDGTITAKSTGGAKGDLNFNPMTATQELRDSGQEPIKSKGPMPPFTIRAIGQHGEGLEAAGGQGTMMRVILPLPGKPMKTGESVTREIILPLALDGRTLPVAAKQTITMGGTVEVGGAKALEITQKIEKGNFTLPPGLTGELDIQCSGTGKAYFDEASGAPLESETAFRMTLKGKLQKTPPPGDKNAVTFPEYDPVEMDSDNYFTLKR